MELNKINIPQKLSLFTDHWHPRIIGDLNDNHIKIAKVCGEFVWHSHAEEDELFLILKGSLYLEFEDQTIRVGPGEMLIVPKGVKHKPYTKDGEEVHLLLVEPKSTKHTGDVVTDKTVHTLDRI